MTPRFWLLAMALAGSAIFLARQPAPTSAQIRPGPDSASRSSQYLGAGSCSASACHGANVVHGPIGGEFTTWATRDTHARAYEVLFDARSAQIQRNLQVKTLAHEDARCLRCHVTPDYDDRSPPSAAPFFKTDGVSCEICHGPAKQWLNIHHLDSWQQKSLAEKQELGMKDTRSLSARVQLCASCHVGGKGSDVDHDLLAAGHPRLHFEFGAFHAHMPRHWPDANDRAFPDFDRRAWLIGQLVTAQRTLEALSERAGNPKNVWPEFAEYDCASCHHHLQADSPRQKFGFGSRKPGALPWGAQLSLTPLALGQLGQGVGIRQRLETLRALMDVGHPKRDEVARNAHEAAAAIKDLLDRLDLDRTEIGPATNALERRLADRMAKAAPESDELTHLYLAIAAFPNAKVKGPAPTFHRFDPQAFHARLSHFKER